MLLSAVFEKFSRDELIKKICDGISESNRLQHILTSCAEELHARGCTDTTLMTQLETLVPAHSIGYHLGDYNQMRESIKMLHAQVKELGAEPIKFRWKFPWLDQGGANGQST